MNERAAALTGRIDWTKRAPIVLFKRDSHDRCNALPGPR
jgi:hypothetical protein